MVGCGFTREVEQGVICVTVKTDVEFSEDIAKVEKVIHQEQWPQNRAQGHT